MCASGMELSGEISGLGRKGSTDVASHTGKGVLESGEVGVAHSSGEASVMEGERRGGTWSSRRESGEPGDGPVTGIVTPWLTVRKLQRTLYRQAKNNQKWKAWSLYGDVCSLEVLRAGCEQVIRNAGGSGIDGMTVEWLASNREPFLRSLAEELRFRRYRANPVRRVYIPKSGGGRRALGIPTVKDRVVQSALALLLTPILEADFHENSFAYRPRRTAHDALQKLQQGLKSGKSEVIDADLSGYFDTIPHGPLLRLLVRRVSDGSILALVRQWLRAPVVEMEGRARRLERTRRGTPQGGVISPLLANLYLNELDHAVNGLPELNAMMVRYADDFVILCAPGHRDEVYRRLKAYLQRKGLVLNEQKTKLLDARCDTLRFLGFRLYWCRSFRSNRAYVHMEPTPEAEHELRTKVRTVLNHWTLWRSAPQVVADLNPVLRGWCNYYHFGNSTRSFARVRVFVEKRVQRWFAGKHQRRGKTRAQWRWVPVHRLYQEYGLYPLPTTAGWKRKR